MKRTLLAFAAAALPLSAAVAGGTFLGEDPASDRKAAKSEAFDKHAEADANADGTITQQEWMTYLAKNTDAPDFDRLDADGDGQVTSSEYQEWAGAESEDSSATGESEGTSGQE